MNHEIRFNLMRCSNACASWCEQRRLHAHNRPELKSSYRYTHTECASFVRIDRFENIVAASRRFKAASDSNNEKMKQKKRKANETIKFEYGMKNTIHIHV